jgi:hypothetical protein
MHRIITLAATAALVVSPLALTVTATQASAAPRASVAAKATTYVVTAKVNKDMAVAREDKVRVTGRVTPKAAGQKVILQQRVGKKKTWKATGTATIKGTGKYVLKDDPRTPGTRQYRVVKPASNGIAKGQSQPVTVVVYAWEKLAYRLVGPRANVTTVGTTIGTDYYTASLVTEVAGTASSIEYTLGRKCLELKATYALTDIAESGSTGAITLSTDGTARVTHALAVGSVVTDHVVDVSDAFRIKFDLTTSATPAAQAAVATPEVLCTR